MILVVTVGLLLVADYGLAKNVGVVRGQDNIQSKVGTANSSIPTSIRNDNTFAGLSDSQMEMMKIHSMSMSEVMKYKEVKMDSEARQTIAKQLGLPLPGVNGTGNPLGMLYSQLPCTCQDGLCGCCTSLLLSAFQSKGCMNITYVPEEKMFEVKMMINDAVWYKTRMSGRRPRPICFTPQRIGGLVEICAKFRDIYFVGRNMHFCLNMDANFQGYEIFDRPFNCMRIGDEGVKIEKPLDLPVDADDDDEDDDDEESEDENEDENEDEDENEETEDENEIEEGEDENEEENEESEDENEEENEEENEDENEEDEVENVNKDEGEDDDDYYDEDARNIVWK